jgi:hypothetical protein
MFPNFEEFLDKTKKMFKLNVFKPISAGFIKNTHNEKIFTLKVCVESGIFSYDEMRNYLNLFTDIFMLKDTGILVNTKDGNSIYYFNANEKQILNILQKNIREIITYNK